MTKVCVFLKKFELLKTFMDCGDCKLLNLCMINIFVKIYILQTAEKGFFSKNIEAEQEIHHAYI